MAFKIPTQSQDPDVFVYTGKNYRELKKFIGSKYFDKEHHEPTITTTNGLHRIHKGDEIKWKNKKEKELYVFSNIMLKHYNLILKWQSLEKNRS